jgi:NAD(P)-dependent dehydrogenase (short-subunit alcohol dehydrogenase family)
VRAEGAEVVLTGRDPERLARAAQEVGAQHTAAFDANDSTALAEFFQGMAAIDQVLVTRAARAMGRCWRWTRRRRVTRSAGMWCWHWRSPATPSAGCDPLLLMGGTGGK